MKYIGASLPFLQYEDSFDTTIACINAIYQSVDGKNIENIKILLDGNFFHIANALLGLYYFLPDDDHSKIMKDNYNRIKNVSSQNSWETNFSIMMGQITKNKMSFNTHDFNK